MRVVLIVSALGEPTHRRRARERAEEIAATPVLTDVLADLLGAGRSLTHRS